MNALPSSSSALTSSLFSCAESSRSSIDKAAATTTESASASAHQNILFLLPDQGAVASSVYASVIEMARYYARFAYVYVARADQGEMTDDEFGVRYMRLSPERLPSFGLLTKVFVFGDADLAQTVTQEHATAEVFLMHSALSVEALAAKTRAEEAAPAGQKLALAA